MKEVKVEVTGEKGGGARAAGDGEATGGGGDAAGGGDWIAGGGGLGPAGDGDGGEVGVGEGDCGDGDATTWKQAHYETRQCLGRALQVLWQYLQNA